MEKQSHFSVQNVEECHGPAALEEDGTSSPLEALQPLHRPPQQALLGLQG